MLIGNQTIRKVHGFSERQLENMRCYLLGAAHVWTRDRKGEWFAARDLLGGANYYWVGTPLMDLYTYYKGNDDNNIEYAVEEAGKAAGRLLKQALEEDSKRTYETREGYTREYRWVGDENLE